MDWKEHLHLTAGALKRWLIAQIQDSLLVGVMWLVGLLLIGVKWALLWAVLAALLQFIPHLGGVLGLIGPAATAFFSDSWERGFWVFLLYGVIVVVDGLILQPYLMKRTVKVPIWASLLAPLVLGIVIPFWGVLLAAPLLAVIYAYKRRQEAAKLVPAVAPSEKNTVL